LQLARKTRCSVCGEHVASSHLRQRHLLLLGDRSQRRFDDIQSFVELFVGDYQRHQNAHDIVKRARRDGD